MEPARSIITSLGGDSAVASLLGLHRVTVARWKLPKSQQGTDGRVPFDYAPALMEAARERGVDLSPADFLPPCLRGAA